MTIALASKTKVAVAKGATWLTPVALGAGDRIPILSTNFDGSPQMLDDDTLVSTAERAPPDIGSFNVERDIAAISDFRQRLLLWALFFGQAGVPAQVEAAVSWKHVFPWKADTTGLFFTYGKHVDVGAAKAMRIASAKTSQLVITGAAGGRVQETFTNFGAGIERDQDPSSWSYAVSPEAGGARHVLFRHATIRANAHGGAALQASDIIRPRAFTLTLNRNLAREWLQSGSADEPQPDGFAALTLRLEFWGATQALVDLLRAAHENETALKLDLDLVGPTLGANNFRQTLYLPYARVTTSPLEIPGPGRVPFAVDLSLHQAPASPTGFPAGYDEAVTVELVNDQSADPLA